MPTEHDPVWLREVDDEQWLTTLEGGASSTSATGDRGADRRRRRAAVALARKPGVRRVIVDVRLNRGGDNTTYGPLLDVLAGRRSARGSSS